jgi:CHAT domain-containing protein/tetratricopeptide (TPR) repeat protein
MKNSKLYLSILLLSILGISPVKAVTTQITSPPNRLQSSDSNNFSLNYAQTLNQKGTEYLAAGKADLALTNWQEAHKIYTRIKYVEGIIGTEINQAQALQSLGFYYQAKLKLESVNSQLQKQPNSALKVRGLFSLGNALQFLRVLDKRAGNATQGINLGAKETLTQALAIALAIDDRESAAQIKLSLGNTLQMMGEEQLVPAINTYQELISSAAPLVKIQAQVNLYRLVVEKLPASIDKYQNIINSGDPRLGIKSGAESNLSRLKSAQELVSNPIKFLKDFREDLDLIPPSYHTIYAYINLAEVIINHQATVNKDRTTVFKDRELLIQVSKLLATAIGQARTIKDTRGEAQAIGSLGHLYELTAQYGEAQKLTQQALMIAENLPAPDIAYRLNWQLGRILTATNPENTNSAIAAYRQAVGHLKSLRNDLNAIDADLQFSFRDSVEPVYRELVALLLKDGGKSLPTNLSAARDLIESLQVAELENFLRQGCLDTYTVQLDKIDRSAVVIYPIVLPDRIAVIASIPNQPLRYYSQKISKGEVEAIVTDLQSKIQNSETDFGAKNKPAFEQQSKRVYDLLLAPLAKDLQQTNTKTLVFVLDGILRNIPMAVLYDGDKYLIEKYNLALTPGLQLVPPQSTKDRGRRQALLGGISEKQTNFDPLPGVKPELEAIAKLIPNEKLINSQFNNRLISSNLVTSNSQIVHLATHGKFSSKPEDTFLLTWNDRLDLNRLSTLLQSRGIQSGKEIDLLVLSACETAQGDNRATLGLAGVAIRARAKSTIASLWKSHDKSTPILMSNLYQNLTTKQLGKAESLRMAQLSLLRGSNAKYQAPYYWGSFVLVGNWQ